MSRSILLLIAVFACLVGLQTSAVARVYLDFSSPNFKKVPMAVPVFVNKMKPGFSSESGKKMSELFFS